MYFRKRQKQRQSGEGKTSPAESSEDAQPYLQQKAELEAKEKRQHELDAQELRYEMEGAQTWHEIEGATNTNETSGEAIQGHDSDRLIQELRGEEHSKELEGSMIE